MLKVALWQSAELLATVSHGPCCGAIDLTGVWYPVQVLWVGACSPSGSVRGSCQNPLLKSLIFGLVPPGGPLWATDTLLGAPNCARWYLYVAWPFICCSGDILHGGFYIHC